MDIVAFGATVGSDACQGNDAGDVDMHKLLIASGLFFGSVAACVAPTSAASDSAADTVAPTAHIEGEWVEGDAFNGSTLTLKDDGHFLRVKKFSALGFVGRGGSTLPHG